MQDNISFPVLLQTGILSIAYRWLSAYVWHSVREIGFDFDVGIFGGSFYDTYKQIQSKNMYIYVWNK